MERKLQIGQVILTSLGPEEVTDDQLQTMPLWVVHTLYGKDYNPSAPQHEEQSLEVWPIVGTIGNKTIQTAADWLRLSDAERNGNIEWGLQYAGGGLAPSDAFFLGLRLPKSTLQALFSDYLRPENGEKIVANYDMTMKVAPEDPKFAPVR